VVWDGVIVLYEGTNVEDNFPRSFNHLMINDPRWCISVYEFEGDYSVLDTHFHLAQHGQFPLDPPDMSFLRLFGQADGFGERFILIIFCNERFDFVDI